MEQNDPDPAIIAQVGSVARPERAYTGSPDLSHLPGREGPITGIMHLWGLVRKGRAHLEEQAQRYGPVYRTQLGRYQVVVIVDPTLAGQILRNADGTWSTALGWLAQFGGIMDGPMDMPLTLDFGAHRDVRRLLQPSFKAEALASYVNIANRHFVAATDQWIADGRVSFKAEARRTFARVAADIFLGVDDEREADELDKTMADFWRFMWALAQNERLSPSFRASRRAAKFMTDHFGAQVASRRRSQGVDLFTRLCQTNETVDWLDDQGLVRVLLGVMAAAFDTTSAAVTNMAYLLATQPEWQEKLRSEALGLDTETVGYGQIRRLEQLDWAWKETLRFYPVAPGVARMALRDVSLMGHRIPAGALVAARFCVAFRDPESFADPDRFDPERFAPPRSEDKRSKGVFMPFGAGHHACIGSQMSSLEAKAFWYQFLRKARIRLAKPYEARHECRPLGVVSGDVALVVEPI
jgi:cytochrome P450